MLNIMPVTTAIMLQVIYNFMSHYDYNSMLRLHTLISPIVIAILQCSYFLPIMLMRNFVPQFVQSWHDSYIIKVFI